MQSARETAQDFLKLSAAKGLQISREIENQHFSLGSTTVEKITDDLFEVSSDAGETILVNKGSELLDAINRSAKLMNLRLFE
jgi:hypothetical protein